MTTEESLKRKSSEIALENAEEIVSEPETKVQKVDQDTSEPNLTKNCEKENHSNGIPADNNAIKECSEEKKGATEESEECTRSSPCSISIKFHDQSIMDKYKTKFVNFLESFVEFQVKVNDDYSIDVYREESLNSDDWVIIDASEADSSASVTETTTVTKTVETLSQDSGKMILNDSSTPSPSKKRKKTSKAKKELFVVDATPSPAAAPAGLRYTTKFTISAEKTEESSVSYNMRQLCFNCDQAHSLKDCPLPKDYTKINVARQKFQKQQQSKSSRYHLEGEQKYSHLAPGKLSSELKKALGLYKNEAPHYIYLMRKLGYPPGWLEEAKFVHSNLEMFGIDGNNLKTSASKKKGLDPAKIIDFPGFNVPFEKGVRDEFKKYGVRPYSDDFSKEAMINFFDKKFAQEEDNLETCDMDIDQEQESSSQEKEIESIKLDDKEGECRNSPSLLDLEQQKQQLLEELKDETKEDKLDKDFLTVKTTHFGTPLLKSNSPYAALPDPDKFSKDVSPVINFENLPNSTGKYEQMTDVLQKVRSTLKRINSCDT